MAISQEEQARREHKAKVKEQYEAYQADIDLYDSQIRNNKRGLETEVPIHLLYIAKDIIKTQNKGVPLSSFQKEILNRLDSEFSQINYDEINRPRIIKRKDGMYIKDVEIITPEGNINYIDLKAPKAFKHQKIETVLSLGDSTFELIDMIADTISENAHLTEILVEQNKAKIKEQEKFEFSKNEKVGKDEFATRMIDLQQLVMNSPQRIADGKRRDPLNLKSVFNDLSNILDNYNTAQNTTMNLVRDEEKTFITDVPIVNRGDIENLDPRADTVKSHTRRHEAFEIEYNLPKDIEMVAKLPKEITEQLIEVLSRTIKENSELHNMLYKKEKIQRKFPWKVVGIVMAALMAAGITIGAIYDFFGLKKDNTNQNDTNIEDVLEENLSDYYPESILWNIDSAEQAHDRLTSYRGNINSGEIADDIYQKVASENKKILSKNYNAETIVGENFEKMGYSEMLQNTKNIFNTLQSQETTDFINALREKRKNNESLTPEEYANYKKLYDYAEDFKAFLQVVEGNVLVNKDFQDLLNKENINLTEKGVERLLGNVGFLLFGSTLGVGLSLIIQNAKKKEAKREKERNMDNDINKDEGVDLK